MEQDSISLIKKELSYYGEWVETEDFYGQMLLPKLGEKTYLNHIFHTTKDDSRFKEKKELYEKFFDTKFNPELISLLKQCDGFGIFSSSLVIGGFGVYNANYGFLLFLKNFAKRKINEKFPDFYAIGYYCTNFVCLSTKKKGVFLVDQYDRQIVLEFKSIYDLVKYAIKELKPNYTADGYVIDTTDDYRLLNTTMKK